MNEKEMACKSRKLQCPTCRKSGTFKIVISGGTFLVTQEEVFKRKKIEWNNYSICICCDCGASGMVGHFNGEVSFTSWKNRDRRQRKN